MRTARGGSRPRRGSASVHAGIHPPPCGPGDPPLGVGLETPLARLLNFTPGWGPGDPPGLLGYHLQGMLGYHLQCMLGSPPHCVQNSWHTLLKILPCPKLRLRAVITRMHSSRMRTARCSGRLSCQARPSPLDRQDTCENITFANPRKFLDLSNISPHTFSGVLKTDTIYWLPTHCSHFQTDKIPWLFQYFFPLFQRFNFFLDWKLDLFQQIIHSSFFFIQGNFWTCPIFRRYSPTLFPES